MSELLRDFMAKKIEVGPQIIGRGILPERSKLVLAGAPKTNKSFIAINIARDLALGRNLFGAAYKGGAPVFPVRRAVRVLYVEMELGEHNLQTRLRQLLSDTPPDMELFVKTRDTGLRLDTPEGRELIMAEVAAVKPDVVMFDPLAKFHLSDENSAQEMGAVMRVGDHLVADFGCALFYIHHTGHNNPMYPRRGGDKLRGSTAIWGDVDTIVTVERKSSESVAEPILQLDFELRCGEPLEPIYLQRLRSGEVVYQGDFTAKTAPSKFKAPRNGDRYGGL